MVLAPALRFNLVRKARVLRDIGASFGVAKTICAHVSWSLRRITRFLDNAEEKQADDSRRRSFMRRREAGSLRLDRAMVKNMTARHLLGTNEC